MRIKIIFDKAFTFKTAIDVQISHINFGGHVGNDSILSIVHEARIRFLNQWNYNELNCDGVSLIMADSAVQYKGESYHGDTLLVEMYAHMTSPKSFDIYYQLTTQRKHETIPIALVKTGMLAFDYTNRKIATFSAIFIQKITQ